MSILKDCKCRTIKREHSKDTILVSVMAVNNEVGAVQPIAEIAKVLEEYPSIHFSCGLCAQAVETRKPVIIYWTY